MKSQNNKMKAIRKTCFMSLFITIMTLLSSCAQDPTEFLEYHKMVFWFNGETYVKLLDDGAETGACVGNYYLDNLKTHPKRSGKNAEAEEAKKSE